MFTLEDTSQSLLSLDVFCREVENSKKKMNVCKPNELAITEFVIIILKLK